MKKHEHIERIAKCRLLMEQHKDRKTESNIAYKAGYPRIALELYMERKATYNEVSRYITDSRCDNIFPNEENANYNLELGLVTEVDGHQVTSLNQFVDLLKKSKNRYVNILFSSNERLIFDKEKAIQSDSETMKRYGITKKERL